MLVWATSSGLRGRIIPGFFQFLAPPGAPSGIIAQSLPVFIHAPSINVSVLLLLRMISHWIKPYLKSMMISFFFNFGSYGVVYQFWEISIIVSIVIASKYLPSTRYMILLSPINRIICAISIFLIMAILTSIRWNLIVYLIYFWVNSTVVLNFILSPMAISMYSRWFVLRCLEIIDNVQGSCKYIIRGNEGRTWAYLTWEGQYLTHYTFFE